MTRNTIDEWSKDHWKVLYLLQKYAKESNVRERQNTWLRKIPLFVFLYDGLEMGIFSFQSAPLLVSVSSQHSSEYRWLQVSQKAISILDDLREVGFVNTIKLASYDYEPVTAYQASIKGCFALGSMDSDMRSGVDKIVHPPVARGQTLLQIHYDGENFLCCTGNYSRTSKITSRAEISYMSRPYIPLCLQSKRGYRMDSSGNKHRSFPFSGGSHSPKGIIHLSGLVALVGEWMPFGANQIAALNDRLGAMERCQGGLFSSMIDENPTKTHFQVAPTLTQVKILDFDMTNFINLEADIRFPDMDGVTQLENFGMHLSVHGTSCYGVQVDSIRHSGSRDIPLNFLPNVLVDIHQHSSRILRDLFSQYQLQLLNMLFTRNPEQRMKYNMILALQITPKLSAGCYLDIGDMENELKQVLGDIYTCSDISSDDVLFLGSNGCLFCGPSVKMFESTLITYMGLRSRRRIVRSFYVRIFILDDALKSLRKKLYWHHSNLEVLSAVKLALSDVTRNITLLMEGLQYLVESLDGLSLPNMPTDQIGMRLHKNLALSELKNDIFIRCKDSIKLTDKLRYQSDTLQNGLESISRLQLTAVSKAILLNTEQLDKALRAKYQSRDTLDLIRFLFAGNVAFDIVDRFTENFYAATKPKWFVDYIQLAVTTYMSPAFFCLSIISLAFIWRKVSKFMQEGIELQQSPITVRVNVDKRISISNLYRLLDQKKINHGVCEYQNSDAELKTYSWLEPHFPTASSETMIELVVEEAPQLLRLIRLQVFCSNKEAVVLNNSDYTAQLAKRRPFASFSSRRLHPFPAQSWNLQGMDENIILEMVSRMLQIEGVYLERRVPTIRRNTQR